MPMTRQLLRWWLVLSTIVMGSLGCETTHSFFRRNNGDDDVAQKKDKDDPAKPKAVESDTSKIMGVNSDEKNPQPFFKSDRRSGGWSSEARDIEKDLGVY
jgi:hypothetical protein